MPIADKITKFSVAVFHSNLHDITRQVRLTLESGGTASISFVETLPDPWLQFFGNATSLFLTADQFRDVYHLLQTESPAYFTALDLFGFSVGSVHTELDLSVGGEVPGEGAEDPVGLPAMIRRARREGKNHK